jgi:hypothetical protein
VTVLEFNQPKSNGRGGRRPGAGRKAGSATKKTREIADKAVEDGITPLEFMLQIMRREPPDVEDPRVLMDAMAMRFEAAKAAAPYMHAKLSSVEMNAKVQTRSLDEELTSLNEADPDATSGTPLA